MQKNKKSFKKRSKKTFTLVTFLQSIYLSVSFFISNDLITYSAACAFGFLFSFIPLVMMILVVLIRILHANPKTVVDILNINPVMEYFFSIKNIADSIMQIKTITNFEIVMGIATIWLARRFFSYVMVSVRKIFKKNFRVQKSKTQVLIFAAEAVLTIFFSVLIFAIIVFKAIIKLPIFNGFSILHPELLRFFTYLVSKMFPYLLIFLTATAIYKVGSRTKPPTISCVLASLGCTTGIFVLHKLMKLFLNLNRYNLIYGVLSNVIVILLEIYFFFIIFLFFAQLLFVSQFFETLLLSELYLLPEKEDTRIKSTVRRILFIRPDFLMNKGSNVISLKKGDIIYQRGDFSTDSFYVVKGIVQIVRELNVSYIEKGKFFGEEACIMERVRNESACAFTNVKIVKIPEPVFFALLERNPTVAGKALSQMSGYFSKFYGRNNEYSL